MSDLFHSITFLFQYFVLGYFALVNMTHAWLGYMGLLTLARYTRSISETSLKDLLERDIYKPISILVPAYNEQATIVSSVQSFLGLHYPEFEVVVIADGPTDYTVDVLIEAFGLIEEPRIWRQALPTQQVKRVLRSPAFPNLLVVDKENGGKADALNAGINFSRFPLVCAVDADSLLDAQALLRASRLFLEDEQVMAVGGSIRPLNGSEVVRGWVKELKLPKLWIERFQVLEYARAFFSGRAGWSAIDALLIISGAFGLFRRNSVLEVGGYRTDTVGEDMELVVRLHRHFREAKIPYRMIFTPDPICWTEVPSDMRTLRRQRNRWHRGLWETLWTHRVMLFNPRYGKLGMLAVPYFWFVEWFSPIVEILGYVMIPISFLTGTISIEFASLFLGLAVLYGVLLSQISIAMETQMMQSYTRLSERLILFATAFLEFLGYRQIITLERFMATFQVMKKRGEWGTMTRKGFKSEQKPQPLTLEQEVPDDAKQLQETK